ncbi:hypothetical protein GCM10023156_37800 [Novipirellula rosea]|uniref:RiboL-PSP-HEPN domain-containing protein n=1 Tax=Novipirellula rosea TaxID=1031540 RepID=A0ABP8N3F3_9BACT
MRRAARIASLAGQGSGKGGISRLNIRVSCIKLVETAETLFADGHYGPAIVIAQAACEVIVDHAMSKAYADKAVPELEAAVNALLNAKSLQNKNVLRLYQTLTSDFDICQQAFWKGYTDMVKLRHRVAHAGANVQEPEARRSIDAATAFVDHVARHNSIA